jgi:hypothetical protein
MVACGSMLCSLSCLHACSQGYPIHRVATSSECLNNTQALPTTMEAGVKNSEGCKGKCHRILLLTGLRHYASSHRATGPTTNSIPGGDTIQHDEGIKPDS